MHDKLVERANQELIDLHKRVLLNYLIQRGLEYPVYRKFFIIYDKRISTKNIREYFHVPCKLFVRALVLDTLNKVSWAAPIPDSFKETKKFRKRKKISIHF